MSLVEVVQVDNQITLWGSVEAEIAEVGIAADHRGDAGSGETGDILGHDDGRAAQKAVRGSHHTADANRDQPVQSAFMRMLDLLNGIRPVRRCLPVTQRTAGNLLTQAPAKLEALRARHGPSAQRTVT